MYVHRSHIIEGTGLHFLLTGFEDVNRLVVEESPKVKVEGQIMYFLVNVSTPKPLDVTTSNFASV